MKKVLMFGLLAVLTVIVVSGSLFARERLDKKTKIFYTTANIWYEKPDAIFSTNFHKGTIIPLGTQVEVLKRSDVIVFQIVGSVDKYKMVFISKHSSISEEEWFDEYFSVQNILADGGAFSKCTDKEKANIKKGIIEPGMSKKAVLMAYGYPPSHITKDLASNMWTYWESRAGRIVLNFENDTLKSIAGQKKDKEAK